MAQFRHVFAATRRCIEAEAVDVEVEWAGERLLGAAEPVDGAIGEHQFVDAVLFCKAFEITFCLSR